MAHAAPYRQGLQTIVSFCDVSLFKRRLQEGMVGDFPGYITCSAWERLGWENELVIGRSLVNLDPTSRLTMRRDSAYCTKPKGQCLESDFT